MSIEILAEGSSSTYINDWVNSLEMNTTDAVLAQEHREISKAAKTINTSRSSKKEAKLVSWTPEEHSPMISRLVKTGMLPAEAEQITVMRKVHTTRLAENQRS
jgi:ribonucleotide monophosphatase NagD (HAD superfamily)